MALGALGGFPALAGMDRAPRPGPGIDARLPRARGDGPVQEVWPPGQTMASPRSRGWTQPKSLFLRWYCGFPALAGMDRNPLRLCNHWYGLPRARGDGPSAAGEAQPGAGASPRSRGWTSSAAEKLRPSKGFPALAGMDPWR